MPLLDSVIVGVAVVLACLYMVWSFLNDEPKEEGRGDEIPD